MGASVNASVSGIDSAASTSFGYWFSATNATAITYTFTGAATADTVVAAPPPPLVSTGAKFATSPSGLLVGAAWTPVSISVTGGLGSTAKADIVGSSYINFAGYGCNMAASAIVNKANAPFAAATASADGTDPWELSYRHIPGQKTYALITLKPDFSLAPAEDGNSGCRLYGSFGEIALSLSGSNNSPNIQVRLEPEWKVYKDVQFPRVGFYFPAPQLLLGKPDIETLFLRQHDQSLPIWQWSEPAPTLTFVKEVPHSVTSEVFEASISAEDEDSNEGPKDKKQEYGDLGARRG